MKKDSNPVISNQTGVHENIDSLVERYNKTSFKKPFSQASLKSFEEIKSKVNQRPNNNIVLDMGCGVGESSFHLSSEFPDSLVVGIDKSIDRLQRNNDFKKDAPANMLLVRADLIDMWRLFFDHKELFNIKKQLILYPNPYPKKKHLKLRWYGQPIFKYILGLGCTIELRSNWEQYLKDFLFTTQLFLPKVESKVECFVPKNIMTPFERKFLNSSQELYRLILEVESNE